MLESPLRGGHEPDLPDLPACLGGTVRAFDKPCLKSPEKASLGLGLGAAPATVSDSGRTAASAVR